MKFKNEAEKEHFVKQGLKYYSDYFEAMFWADIDDREDLEYDGYLDFSSIDLDSAVKQIEDLDKFFQSAESILEWTEYTDAQAQHDFYLTRCGHGAGFWDGDHCSSEMGQVLTTMAQSFGPVDIVVSSDGVIYLYS